MSKKKKIKKLKKKIRELEVALKSWTDHSPLHNKTLDKNPDVGDPDSAYYL